MSHPRAKAPTLGLVRQAINKRKPLLDQLQCLKYGTNPAPACCQSLLSSPEAALLEERWGKGPPSVCRGVSVAAALSFLPRALEARASLTPTRQRAQALGKALTAPTPPRPSVPCTGGPASGPGRWPPTCGGKGGRCAASCLRAVPPGALLPPEKPRGKGEPYQQPENSRDPIH